MPNWCYNHIAVKGSQKRLKEFEAAAMGENGLFDFNSFVPYPEHYTRLDQVAANLVQLYRRNVIGWEDDPNDGYNAGGYNWCVLNWGTKWNACEVSLDKTKDRLYYSFDTAWGPPIQVIKAIGKRFPHLTVELYYHECGESFSGNVLIEKGKIREQFRPYCDCDFCSQLWDEFSDTMEEIYEKTQNSSAKTADGSSFKAAEAQNLGM
ncbi:MAG TPA: hypothetical protein PK661_09605 [Syntrophorhabdaceae bacterium]|jgi:hypothetical protein|nr:hypothetical protein [Pseudomonadota bacterium]HOS60339.1 hypothetical protein [Syntrophorhabdaceae bacterium]HQP51966.1 hypothetical protein [Syntrophorhabdaceae bacterium]